MHSLPEEGVKRGRLRAREGTGREEGATETEARGDTAAEDIERSGAEEAEEEGGRAEEGEVDADAEDAETIGGTLVDLSEAADPAGSRARAAAASAATVAAVSAAEFPV